MDPTPFFDWCTERQAIYERRLLGGPRPWTKDPILAVNRFCNVFREQDRTTMWMAKYVRTQVDIIPAIVIFRWFNRIATGEAIFNQLALYPPGTTSAFYEFMRVKKGAVLYHAIKNYCGAGPYVTGAYIVYTPPGVTKLQGVCDYCEKFLKKRDANKNNLALNWPYPMSLENSWNHFRTFEGIGDFGAYEIVTDLRHTAVLGNAPDIMSWANAGPGAVRGLNRLHGRPLTGGLPKKQSLEEMRELLALSLKKKWWKGPPMEMRDIEHSLCETDKYLRLKNGEGRVKGKF